MNDRAVNLLEQYDVEVWKTRKGRGSFLCDTDKGCLILKEYTGNEEKLCIQNKILSHLQGEDICVNDDTGEAFRKIVTESLLPTREGSLTVTDYDGTKYILKTYMEGRECNVNDRTECLECVRLLSGLHAHMAFDKEAFCESEKPEFVYSPTAEYDKRNAELRRARKYLRHRSQKTWFEIYLQEHYDYFLEQAYLLREEWAGYEKIRHDNPNPDGYIHFCHGDYQYHNILKISGPDEISWFVMNFEKCIPDDPIRDLYLLMRKLLEKSNWSITLGKELLGAYEEERPLSAISKIDLYYRFAYPEKFWKVVNFYYNSGKAWIPGRNLEKLKKIVEQEPYKQAFLDSLFRTVFEE